MPASISGIVEPDGDPTTITIVRITQDEPVTSPSAGAFTGAARLDALYGDREDKDRDEKDRGDRDGDRDHEDDDVDDVDDIPDDVDEPATCRDAAGVGTSTASVRAERDENGDGRVYHVTFRVDDGRGGQCTGTVTVCVLSGMSAGASCVDQGPIANSTPIEWPLACDMDGCDGHHCDAASRFLALECVLETPYCEDDYVPGGVVRRLERARGMFQLAVQAEDPRRERKLVKKAMRHLAKAYKMTWGAVRRGTMSAGCAAELRGILYEAKTRTIDWIRSM